MGVLARSVFCSLLMMAALGCSSVGGDGKPGQPVRSPQLMMAARTFTVTFLAGPGGSLKGTQVQTVPQGGSTTPVAAVPGTGQGFNAWTDEGFVTRRKAAITVSPVTRDLTLTANFGGGVVGGTAADVAGIDEKGAPCALSDYAGSVILMDISAAWCYWCQVDAPAVQALHLKYADKGVRVVTVLAEDDNGAGPVTLGNLKAWTSTFGLTFRVQSDASGAGSGVGERVYASQPASDGFPTLVIIDKHFKVQYLSGGYDAAAVGAKLDALLAK